MKRLFVLSVAIMGAVLNYVPAAHADGDKVLICHIPPGNPDNAHEILIDDSAWPAHLAHGDYLGACVVDPQLN
jgi:hypothetical protein